MKCSSILAAFTASKMKLNFNENSNNSWKESKYGVFSGPYFPVFRPNTEKCGPEKTPYFDTFHAMQEP